MIISLKSEILLEKSISWVTSEISVIIELGCVTNIEDVTMKIINKKIADCLFISKHYNHVAQL